MRFYILTTKRKNPYNNIILSDGDGNGSKVQTKFAKVMIHQMAELCPTGVLFFSF